MPSRIASSPTMVTPLGISTPSSLPPQVATPSAITSPPSTGRPSYDGRTLSGKVRRLTNSDAALQRRTDHERSTTPGSDGGAQSDGFVPRMSLRTRPSWMKRLSAMSTTSSTPSSPRPESPTLLPSNASAAFSNTGSTVPMVGSSPVAPLPPNKLVKRQSSQRLAGDTSRSKVPTLRRPATSHQRSATLKSFARNSSTPSDPLSSSSTDKSRKSSQSETRWKQFFSVKVSRGGAFSRNSASPMENSKGIRRVLPDDRYYPTLITAKSVVTSTLDVDDFPEYDDDSVFFRSRPPSALGLESLTIGNSGRMSTSADESLAQPVPSVDDMQNNTRPRRSFSLHDLLTLGPSRKNSTNRVPANKLTKKSGRRVVSAPLAAISNQQQNDSDSERPSKRREVTSPAALNQDNPSTQETVLQFSDVPSGTDPTSPGSHFTFTSQTHSTTSQAGDYSPSISHPSSFLGTLKLDQNSYSQTLPQENLRPSNHSVAPSEQTSTLIGSEIDARFMSSTNEDDGEANSDSAFDSLRTRVGRSTSGARATRITQFFDDPPPQRSIRSGLQEILPLGMLSDRDTSWRKSSDIIEEEESNIGTPVRTIRSDKADDGSPTARRLKNRSLIPLSMKLASSPPDLAKPLSLGTLEYDDPVTEGDEKGRWYCFDDESGNNSDLEDWGSAEQVATPLTIRRSNPFLVPAISSSSNTTTPQYPRPDSSDKENRKENTKSNIFDWSEQPAEKSPGNRSPPRPRTVHGKKDADTRGSRSNKRRAPSGLHVRSQSVPVVPDLAGKRETVITNKFGTWGVGSKGVSEDWDEDFDFGDGMPVSSTAQTGEREDRRIDSGIVMHIPQVIREHQAAVVNNIGLVREFGLLIEELKALRSRVVSIGLLNTMNREVWEEIDCMIDLADQEAEDPAIPIPQRSPPSSPGWDMPGFDESFEGPSKDHAMRITGRTPSGGKNPATITPTNPRKVRKSVLPTENDVFSGPLSSTKQTNDTTPPVVVTRPRKDSEALARSIIETLTLKKRKDASDPMISLHPMSSTRKVPFDTNTLRHIVPYVNGLVRKVKEQLREAEGLDLSRDSSPDWNDAPSSSRDPPFSRMFKDQSPTPNSPSPKARGSRANNNNNTSNSNEGHQTLDDLNKQMKLMTVM
jgi:hypothetical protein